MDESELLSKLWGDYFYDPDSKEWFENSIEGKLQRSFCQFILKPIQNILRSGKNTCQLEHVLTPLEITISIEEQELPSDELLTNIMSKWLPASNCVYEMIIDKLPSPKKAQHYRCENIYTGSLTDRYANSIKNCDADGPLMIHVSKTILSKDGMYISIGRIFSGRIRKDTSLRIMEQSNGGVFLPKNVFEDKLIMDLVQIHGSNVESIEEASCGAIIGLVGIAKFITKSATITESDNLDASTFKELKSNYTSMVDVAIEPEKQVNLPMLIKGMEKIAQCDPSLTFSLNEMTEEKILTVSSEFHLRSALNRFKQIHSDIEITISQPLVHFQESITDTSEILLVKSPNKHNRLYLTAEPLQEDLVYDIEKGLISFSPYEDIKQRARVLSDQYGWDLSDARTDHFVEKLFEEPWAMHGIVLQDWVK